MTKRRTGITPCSACGEQKPRTREFYYADRRASDGLHSCCKTCHLKRTAAHEKTNPRDRTEYHRAWFAANREQVRLRASRAFAKWRKENRAKRLEWEANYRRTETYRKANIKHQAKRREREIGAEGSHTFAEFHDVLIRQAFRCFYCGTDITTGATEDHFIPLSKGGSNDISNIRAACLPCNRKKGNRQAATVKQEG